MSNPKNAHLHVFEYPTESVGRENALNLLRRAYHNQLSVTFDDDYGEVVAQNNELKTHQLEGTSHARL